MPLLPRKQLILGEKSRDVSAIFLKFVSDRWRSCITDAKLRKFGLKEMPAHENGGKNIELLIKKINFVAKHNQASL